jgi:hypothetical protein
MLFVFKAVVKGFTDLLHPAILKKLFLFSFLVLLTWLVSAWAFTQNFSTFLSWSVLWLPKYETHFQSAAQLFEQNTYGIKFFLFLFVFFLISPLINLASTLTFSFLILFWTVSFLKKHHYPEISNSPNLLNLRLIRDSLLLGFVFLFLAPVFLILLVISPPVGSALMLAWGAFASSRLLGQELAIELLGPDSSRYRTRFSQIFVAALAISLAGYLPFFATITPLWLTMTIGHILKQKA